MKPLSTNPAEQADRGWPRLLLVDDDAADRAVIVRALGAADLDCDVEEATSAVQGLARLGSGSFDIALIDADLPDGDHLQLLRKARDGGVAVPVIMLTAHADERAAVELVRAGASDYLSKSTLTAGQLEQSIRTALRVHRAEREAAHAAEVMRRHVEQMDQLARAAVRMTGPIEIEELLDQAAECARTILGTHEAMVTFAPDGNWEHAATRLSLSERYGEYRSLVPDPDRSGLLATVRTHPRVVRLDAEALAEHPAFRAPAPDEDWLLPLRGWLAAPLIGRGGHNIGVIQLSHRTQGDFVPADEPILLQLAQLVSGALENARLYAAANEASQARERVLATVSHDLRNPLNTIVMGSALLLEETLPPDQTRKHLNVIRRSADTMNRMIQDLLDVSRIEAGYLSIEPEEIETAAAVRDACEMLEQLAREKELDLRCHLQRGLPRVAADRDRLLQVFSNLVGNAIKFSEPGGHIDIVAERSDQEICFAVSDDGPGITRDDLLHIFEPFWQAEAQTSGQGAGLGLTIARGIIEAHGGQLTCESEPGQGTTFRFTLPIASLPAGAGAVS